MAKFWAILLGVFLFVCDYVFWASVSGISVMLLWNWLMPEIFNLGRISFFQAVGLIVLIELLFKSNSSSSKKDD